MTFSGLTVYGCDPGETVLFGKMAPRFGVRPTLTSAAVCEGNVDLARGHRCISISHRSHVSHGTLRALARAGVEYVSTRSIGCNHLDVAFATRLGLRVGNVTYSPDSVADYTLMLMLMLLRRARSIMCRALVGDFRLAEVRGRELRDLTVGVVGTGRIGTAVIDRLRGFGCQVLAYDVRAGAPTHGAAHVGLDEMLRRSDVLTLHTPLAADTHHLLDRQRIEQLKPGAYVINTARGALLDTKALVSALERGALGGAALDVLEGEEGIFYADRRGVAVDETWRRLQRLPNVLISPHTAYYTDHALVDIVENTLINCLEFEGGRSWTG